MINTNVAAPALTFLLQSVWCVLSRLSRRVPLTAGGVWLCAVPRCGSRCATLLGRTGTYRGTVPVPVPYSGTAVCTAVYHCPPASFE